MGDVSGHLLDTRAIQGGAPPPGDLGYEISRRIAAGCAKIGPTNAAAAAKVGRRISPFFGHSRLTYTFLPQFLDPLNSFSCPFSQILHSLKDTTKTNLADCWIDFFDYYRNLWTKVRVLMCSWSLGLSIDIKFVNFGRRLVSFPFLGHLG